MIPLSDLKAPAVRCAWHEVAALVLDAATALTEQPASDLSNLATIHLAEEGHVALPPGNQHPSPAGQLAQLLDTLLQDLPAPDALRAIAAQHLAAPPDEGSLEAFVSQLSRFERPDRAAILSQLAARAASVARTVDGPTALAQLASRVREHDRAGLDATGAGATVRRGKGLRIAVLTACAFATVAVALVTLAYFLAPPRPAGAAPQPVVARVRAGVTQIVAAAKSIVRSTPAPEPAPAPSTLAAAPAAAGRASPKRSAGHVPRADAVVSVTELEGRVLAREPATAADSVPAPADPTVYTSADADVTPAALLRSHLPSQPAPTLLPDDLGTLELTVTETGKVSHVRLISVSNRYQERMLVAAAKTWRFQPAMKNGVPVRFRARVRITV
jgi:TonB family protein